MSRLRLAAGRGIIYDPMSDPIVVFVNDRPVRLAPGASVRDAVAAADPALAARLAAGGETTYVTDARGLRLPLEEVVFAGAIVRVVASARTPPGEVDAHS